MTAAEVLSALERGEYDAVLSRLYGSDTDVHRARYLDAVRKFNEIFASESEDSLNCDRRISIYSAPGRSEICGNHLDHQKGCVIAAAVDMDMIAVVSQRSDRTVNILSEGFSMLHVDLNDTKIHDDEAGTSAALVRGVAAGFAAENIPLYGFDAYVNGNVPAGSGLSSSAAFEVLIGNIFNGASYDHGGRCVDARKIAMIGQHAENMYFGKPSGLMDQMACSLGGITYMDFENEMYESLSQASGNLLPGISLCISATGGSHEDLTEEYAAVRGEMNLIAGSFGAECLRNVKREDFFSKIPELRERCGDRAVLRAAHFYDEMDRVEMMKAAVSSGDIGQFLSIIRESGNSSYKLLQNIYPAGNKKEQPVALALMLSEEFIRTRGGACRVHGGGFAGTIQTFVPDEAADDYRSFIEKNIGPNCCSILHIRTDGGVRIV